MGENELHFKYKSFDFWNRAAQSCGCVVVATFAICYPFRCVCACGDGATGPEIGIKCELRHDLCRFGRELCAKRSRHIARTISVPIWPSHANCAIGREKSNWRKNALFNGIHRVNTEQCSQHQVHLSSHAVALRRCASGNNRTTAVEEETNEIFILNWICRSRCGRCWSAIFDECRCFFPLLFLCVILSKWPACFSHSRVHMSKSIQKLWRKHEIAFIRYFDSISRHHVSFIAFCSISLLD